MRPATAPRTEVRRGPAAGGIALAACMVVTESTGALCLAPTLFLAGLGPGLTFTVTAEVVLSETAYELGAALGIAVLGSLLTGIHRGFPVPADVPAQVAAATHDSLGGAVRAATALPRDQAAALPATARDAFTDGFRTAAVSLCSMIGKRLSMRISGSPPSSGPQRALIVASFVSRVGNGLFNTASVLYFTLVVHLPAAQVGIGLTVAGLVGLAAGIPAGNLADRYGPRTVWLASVTVQAAAMTAFVFIHDWVTFTLVATLDRLAATASGAAGGALIARAGGPRPAAFRARLRTFVNLGVVLGTLGAAVAVSVGTREAYTVLILANAASFAGAALVALRGVPAYRPLPRPPEHHRRAVLSDRPYLSFVALYGAMGLQYQTVSLLLPVWLSAHTDAPRWTVAAVYAVNSGVCVLLQSRIGSRVETPRQGGRALRVAGLLFLVSCPLMALTADVPVWMAPLLAVLAVALHSLGEVWESSGGFALGFGLAPDHAQGQYQGLFGLGFNAGQALAPLVLTTAVLGLGHAGWLLLGVFFAALGAAGPPVAAWAERTRRPPLPTPPPPPRPDGSAQLPLPDSA
ncbi:MFS transporter [Streptomyces sp. NPDC048551]|uniref:MFS transporter n=1 Tax=Streptomyces sp. NPDC048551 TaxID=3155758 RepID=UPI00341AED80